MSAVDTGTDAEGGHLCDVGVETNVLGKPIGG